MQEIKKKGQVGTSAIINGLLAVVLLGAVAGLMFTSLNITNLGANAPSWTPTVFAVVLAIGILTILLRSFGIKG